jgi:SAM-dependent methyltransferase
LSKYRARYFAGCTHVLEIGTGTGSDTAALAEHAKKVTTVEQDPLRTAMAQHNLGLQGITNVEFITGDIKALSLSLSQFDALFADPARRTRDGVRVKDAALYSPPLEELLNLPIDGPRAIKVSPGLFFDQQLRGWSRQFLGYQDQCLEQTLWKGVDITDSSAVVVDAEEMWSPPAEPLPERAKVDSLGKYLFEAHGVINRSLRLDDFFTQLGIDRFDNDVAYGTSDELVKSSRLLSRYTVLDNFRYSRKTLLAALNDLQWTSRTEFKKRACHEDLEEIRRAMKLPSHHGKGEFGTVFLFRWRDCNWVVLGKRDNE